jgi:hypothetical protein
MHTPNPLIALFDRATARLHADLSIESQHDLAVLTFCLLWSSDPQDLLGPWIYETYTQLGITSFTAN